MARFLLAQRLSTQKDEFEIQPSIHSINSAFETNFASKSVSSFVNKDTQFDPAQIIITEGRLADIQKERKNLPPDFILEEEKTRNLNLLHPMLADPNRFNAMPAGMGAEIRLTISTAGKVLRKAITILYLSGIRHGFMTTVKGLTDKKGRVSLPYNPSEWIPNTISVSPRSSAWSASFPVTNRLMNLMLPVLPRTGHLGWWHRAMGLNSYSQNLGEGIRVGIIDSGVGPHPYLSHVKRLGALVGGVFNSDPKATTDVVEHGTHVAGTIGARPITGSNDFGGVAPGAELVSIRIYPGGGDIDAESGSTTNGDIAQAILMLSRDEQCDIINISSGGLLYSAIEADRIAAAMNKGTLVICSVGNGGGPPVFYPAADPFVIGVSAVGLTGGVPPGVMDMMSYPAQFDRYSPFGYFVPNFVSLGPEVKCTGPGVGIIATAPMKYDETEAAYVGMSGTSMATPAVVGILAARLSRDSVYQSLPRTRERWLYAVTVLNQTLRSLNLPFQYQGYGMPWVGGLE